MAKKVYFVTLTDGSTQEFTSKKAIKTLREVISQVTVDGQDITAQFVKEDKTMAQKVTVEQVVANVEDIATAEEVLEMENIEVAEELVEDMAEPEVDDTPKAMLLFTASRGKNTKFNWFEVYVKNSDPTVKVKGCAIELPTHVAEIIGNDKFVSYLDEEMIQRCVDEQKAVRGTASTVSDVSTRYRMVTDAVGDRLALALEVFTKVLTEVKQGTTGGAWERPEPKKEEPKQDPEIEVVDVEEVTAEEVIVEDEDLLVEDMAE